MKRLIFCFVALIAQVGLKAQTASQKMAAAYALFEKDSQLRHATIALYVIDATSGNVIFDRNSGVGMAPASTQKIITAASAYELLGKDFRFETRFGYSGTISKAGISGNIVVDGSGDPTLGSWRWKRTTMDSVIARLRKAFLILNVRSYQNVVLARNNWESGTIPEGWIWQDIGNYYGAGAGIVNWHENQYDLVLRSGAQTGSAVQVVKTVPYLYGFPILSKLTAGAKGSGDRSYIFFAPGDTLGVVRGTIPVSEDNFVVGGAMPSGERQFIATLRDSLLRAGIASRGKDQGMQKDETITNVFHTEFSPPLDSIVYWFLRKSINLYGEALVKAMAARNAPVASTRAGVTLVKNYWKAIGIDPTSMNISDGSGLSPQNRVTAATQVFILNYARGKAWFPGYFAAFPEYNGMKMKSGTIADVKAFCGYHTASSGQHFIFSFIVNNYNGAESGVVKKMYAVLDQLK